MTTLAWHGVSDLFLHVTGRLTESGKTIMRRIFVLMREDVTEGCGKYKNIYFFYLYPFSVHVVTFNFITNLMHLFN